MTDSSIRILAIDDEKLVLALLARYLRALHYDVIVADTGEKGLEMFREQSPDLVLVDIKIPDVDGLTVLERIKRQSPTTPVIIISGKGTKKDVIKALKLGACDYLVKPFDEVEILEHAINRALERVKLLDENKRFQEALVEQLRQDYSDLEKRSQELERAYQNLNKEFEKRSAAEKAIERERAMMQTLIDGVREPAAVVDPDYNVLMMNQVGLARLPGHLAASQNLRCFQAFRQADAPCGGQDHPCVLPKLKESGAVSVCMHKDAREDGSDSVWEVEALPLWNEDATLRGFLEVFRNISDDLDVEAQLQEHQARLYHMAHHDTLTNLPNRMLFRDRLQRMMLKAKRYDNMVAVLFLDLDRFKKINETLGYDIGDRVLCLVAERLDSCVRRSDTVSRLGGDEFAIVLDDLKDLKFVAIVARKILDSLSKPLVVNDFELYVTTSIGISIFPNDSENVDDIMRCAETAMYRAKETGKNNYQYFTVDMNARAFEFLLMESGLRKAIENDELTVFYQPQIELQGNSLIGMEALLRWNHPERGMISPDDFIPLAEETGLIVSIGEWVLRQACFQNKAWQNEGYPPIRVSVNISSRQFHQQNIVELVSGILAESGLDPKYLKLELTESIVMHDAEIARKTLQKLGKMGIKLAIDDFGTGYSSLSYLKLFPIDFLKIDKSFVFNIMTDSNDAAIADSIIALAHSMNLKVIAEGVEDRDQLERLRGKGCDIVQGFLFSAPLAPDKFVPFFNALF